ncbi:MAG: MFS transporter [Thermonemataceae bacterium]
MTQTFQKNQPKVVNAWAMYDWANSVFSLVIVSSVFPAYYQGVIQDTNNGSDLVTFLGFTLKSGVLFEYTISASFLIIALLSPMLTAVADYGGRKKTFMQFFCILGALGCGSLFFFDSVQDLPIGIIGFMAGLIGFAGSIVFNNSYLPDIVTEDQFDRVSAKGFSLGYIGSVLLLIVSLALILKGEAFGISGGLASRIVFLVTGVWWVGFAQYSFAYMPRNVYQRKAAGNWLLNGFQELGKVWEQVKGRPLLKKFLIAYFFFNMGVQTVIYVAALFGEEELNLDTTKLILTILVIQLVAIVGAWGFSRLSKRYGNIKALVVAVVIWIGICIGAYFTYTETMFYILAAVVGSVLGGIQSLSRATYAKLMPDETPDTASFFSFYDVTEKVSIVLGTLVYGILHQQYSMRISILALMVFFIIGLLFLVRIPSKNTYED